MSNPAGYLPAKNGLPPIPQLKFQDADKFEKTVNAYFDSISVRTEVSEPSSNEESQPTTDKGTEKYVVEWLEPPTIVGLGCFLDCDYRIFQDYEADKYDNHPQMTPELSKSLKQTMHRARQICHKYTLGSVFTSKSANGPIFVLKTVYKDHGYQEDTTINVNTTIDDKRINYSQLPVDELVQLRRIMGRLLSIGEGSKLQENAEDADFEEEAEDAKR